VSVDQLDFPHPIFIGGSARTGTHAMGRLICSLPPYAMLGLEARFHCANDGLSDLLTGRTDLDTFRDRVLGMWWSRGLLGEKGLSEITSRERIEAMMDAFAERFESDPWEAGRELVRGLLDPVAERQGKPAWVDVSGFNVRAGPVLHRLFPRAKVVHMVRDGRAVVASILNKRDQTDDREVALSHWLRRIRYSHEGLREMGPDEALTVDLDALTATDREVQFARLVEFLEVSDSAPMREHFDTNVSAERANVGEWRSRLSPADARWLNRRYRTAVRELRREGIDWVPEP
jgi:hypothetical protein